MDIQPSLLGVSECVLSVAQVSMTRWKRQWKKKDMRLDITGMTQNIPSMSRKMLLFSLIMETGHIVLCLIMVR